MKWIPSLALLACVTLQISAWAQSVEDLVGKRTVFLGDSITQGGGYVGFTEYFLEKLHPEKRFDVLGLGLSSETVSGLTEEKHPFPRPCLFERLGRVLEKAKPEVVFACYGMNDGVYKPLDTERFAAFRKGIEQMVQRCQAAGVKQIYLVTPPIFDAQTAEGEFNYDTVLTEYAAWERGLKLSGVTVIDLHTAMRAARGMRTEVFSKDKVHPGEEGHLVMARTILAGLGQAIPEMTLEAIKADPLYGLVNQKRVLRSNRWMNHIGYTRGTTVEPQPLGTTEEEVAALQEKIDVLRKKR